MITFQVPDMTCGHCASAITRAVAGVDPGARVDVALDACLVRIADARAGADALADAIRGAGYTPAPVRAPLAPAAAATARGGCGGGCR